MLVLALLLPQAAVLETSLRLLTEVSQNPVVESASNALERLSIPESVKDTVLTAMEAGSNGSGSVKYSKHIPSHSAESLKYKSRYPMEPSDLTY